MTQIACFVRQLLAILVITLSVGATEAQTYEVYSPGDGFLNLRTGPSTDHAIIRKMYNGSTVDVLASQGKWRKVQHDSGAIGWAYRDYMVKLSGPNPGADWRVVHSPNDGFLNLRTGPSTAYAIIQPMYNGQYARVLRKQGKWLRVQHEGGAIGWAYATYLLVP